MAMRNILQSKIFHECGPLLICCVPASPLVSYGGKCGFLDRVSTSPSLLPRFDDRYSIEGPVTATDFSSLMQCQVTDMNMSGLPILWSS
jgi:hypothetical protein